MANAVAAIGQVRGIASARKEFPAWLIYLKATDKR
jgi:hypothetical protein